VQEAVLLGEVVAKRVLDDHLARATCARRAPRVAMKAWRPKLARTRASKSGSAGPPLDVMASLRGAPPASSPRPGSVALKMMMFPTARGRRYRVVSTAGNAPGRRASMTVSPRTPE
jgi:hypothetical protein